ncbi:MAG: RNA recognition motif domain-containing protein [Sandaracinaceae bacterium]
MSTPEKRAREQRKAEKKREKSLRRRERRERGAQEVPIASAEDVTGPLRSIEEVMQEIYSDASGTARAAPVPSKLFVGSLSYDTTSESLRDAFTPFGEVAEAVVINDRDTGRSRGFGFVTMADRKDAAKAIEALNESELDGRTIVVNVASDRR